MVENSVLRREVSKLLSGADLNAITSKKVRTELERTLGVSLVDRKGEIEDAIRAVLEAVNQPTAEEDSKLSDNDDEDTDSSLSDLDGTSAGGSTKRQPARTTSGGAGQKKKNQNQQSQKRKSGVQSVAKKADKPQEPQKQLSDEELARQLHMTENGLPRRRAAAINSASATEKKPRKSNGGGGGFSKPCALSPALADVLGCDSMPRQQVVKRLWDMAKERNLFDPKNKQFVICDAQFEKLFNKKRLRMFALMKYLKNHVRNLED